METKLADARVAEIGLDQDHLGGTARDPREIPGDGALADAGAI